MEEAAQYEVVIGLEVHAQLLTRTKLFCSDTTAFGQAPNTQVSVVSLGHPGTLPKMNKEAIDLAIKLGLATNCQIVKQNYFARKNYFYPDLPKGYQISQHTTPICINGFLKIESGGEEKHIRINRIHMEEDAGKSMHESEEDYSNLDFNRAGMPLVEIVTEPDLRTADAAAAYVTKLRKLVRHLEVCDGNMEQGSLRCDVNISVRKKGDELLGTKVEIKNLNSIRFIKKAIEYEGNYLIEQHKKGIKILQQTKGFDEATSTTYVIRTKEDEDDYRYFPDPDLPPFYITNEWIEKIKSQLPPSQDEVKNKLIENFGLSEYDAALISEDNSLVNYFTAITTHTKNYKAAANWIIGPIKSTAIEHEISMDEIKILPSSIAQLINLVDEGKINYGVASQNILLRLLQHPHTDILQYINENSLQLQSSDDMDEAISAALTKHAEKITEYKKGKKGLISLFVGEVMKQSKGKANAKLVTEKIIEKLKDHK